MSLPDHTTLYQAFEQMEGGLAFYGPDGELLFANRVMRKALDGAAPELLANAVSRTSAEAREALRRSAAGGVVAERVVGADDQRYWVKATILSREPDSAICLQVSFSKLPGSGLSEVALQTRFGLSPQESRVAVLLAEGRSNQQVAAALQLSQHTARNYTRRVLQRLRVTNRAQVGSQLLWDR